MIGTVWCATALAKRSGDPKDENFCDYTLLAYSVSQIILWYIILFAIIVIVGCASYYGKSRPNPGESAVPVEEPRHQNLQSGQSRSWGVVVVSIVYSIRDSYDKI